MRIMECWEVESNAKFKGLERRFRYLVGNAGEGKATVEDVENLGREFADASAKIYHQKNRADLAAMRNSLYSLAVFIDPNAMIDTIRLHPVDDKERYIPIPVEE